MLFGFTSAPWKRLTIYSVIRIWKWLGIPFTETTVHLFDNVEKASHILGNCPIGLHLPNKGNAGYDFSCEEKKLEIIELINSINNNREHFNLLYAVFHLPETDCSNYNFFLQNLKRIKLPLVLENTAAVCIEKFSAEYHNLKQHLGSQLFGLCLDIPHAMLGWDQWESFFCSYKNEIKVIHLSDFSGSRDSHLPFGCGGRVDLKGILSTLKNAQFDGIVNYEINPERLRQIQAVMNTYLITCRFFDFQLHIKAYKRTKWIIKLTKIFSFLS